MELLEGASGDETASLLLLLSKKKKRKTDRIRV